MQPEIVAVRHGAGDFISILTDFCMFCLRAYLSMPSDGQGYGVLHGPMACPEGWMTAEAPCSPRPSVCPGRAVDTIMLCGFRCTCWS